ncbi:MAG: hypothetical protein DRP56_08705 [Planctomycetota bacterium]|nr:MAG: hypothetical protein DRP56_08705 [Planctomycetota bacterium]
MSVIAVGGLAIIFLLAGLFYGIVSVLWGSDWIFKFFDGILVIDFLSESKMGWVLFILAMGLVFLFWGVVIGLP